MKENELNIPPYRTGQKNGETYYYYRNQFGERFVPLDIVDGHLVYLTTTLIKERNGGSGIRRQHFPEPYVINSKLEKELEKLLEDIPKESRPGYHLSDRSKK